ncbi:MAG: hypothetical protein H6837_06090 [Planctomycetes bacterium]|nr:hypothetical protein [Planctomycetota bacterium]
MARTIHARVAAIGKLAAGYVERQTLLLDGCDPPPDSLPFSLPATSLRNLANAARERRARTRFPTRYESMRVFPRQLFPMLLPLVLLGAPVPAQADVRRNEVVGVTAGTATSAPRLEWQRSDFAGCAVRGCALPGFETSARPWAGGTAFNGDVPPNLSNSLGGVWVSNGRKIALVDPAGCAMRCPAQDAPLTTPTADVTGLAYWEQEAGLLLSDSTNLLYWVSPNQCAMTAVVCDTWQKSIVPTGFTIAGLASDDVNRLLFVSASTFSSTPVRSKLWATYLGFPRRPIDSGWCAVAPPCEITIPTCGTTPLGPITGLGYDACTGTLYWTDGRTVVAGQIKIDTARSTCTLSLLGCCTKSSGEPFTGLCVAQKQPFAVGTACVQGGCTACPTMVASSYGAPFLGNRNFALTLRNAPTGAMPVFLALAIGGCTAPGVPIGFCETARIGTSAPPLLIPMRVARVGSGPCDGHADFSFGVPVLPQLCGTPMSAQWAMDCTGPNGPGQAITNCLTFEVTTN